VVGKTAFAGVPLPFIAGGETLCAGSEPKRLSYFVIAGLDPAIHAAKLPLSFARW
jgi:hypothetical protein